MNVSLAALAQGRTSKQAVHTDWDRTQENIHQNKQQNYSACAWSLNSNLPSKVVCFPFHSVHRILLLALVSQSGSNNLAIIPQIIPGAFAEWLDIVSLFVHCKMCGCSSPLKASSRDHFSWCPLRQCKSRVPLDLHQCKWEQNLAQSPVAKSQSCRAAEKREMGATIQNCTEGMSTLES